MKGIIVGEMKLGNMNKVLIKEGKMKRGMKNDEKEKKRKIYEEGKVGREEMME